MVVKNWLSCFFFSLAQFLFLLFGKHYFSLIFKNSLMMDFISVC